MKKISDSKKELLLIICAFFVYAISYLTRYSVNSNVNSIIDYYGVDTAEFGLIGTFFFISYGIGQFVNAFLSKKYNKRIIIPLSLLASSILNLVLFFKPPFYIYKYLWLINGATLSILWPTLIATLSENISRENIKKAIVIISASVAAGSFVIYGISALFNINSEYYHFTFITSACIAVAMSVVWLILYPFLTKRDNPILAQEKTDIRNKQSSKPSFVLLVLLITMGVVMIITNLVKDGTTTWVPKILKDSFGFTDSLTLVLTLLLPVFGAFGATVAVLVNSKLSNYMMSCGIFMSVSSLAIGLILLSLNKSIVALTLVMFGIISLLMHSVNSLLTSAAPMELRGKVNSGMLAGILNGCGYIGSAISSFGLGYIGKEAGWNTVILVLLIACGICALISLIVSLLLRKTNARIM